MDSFIILLRRFFALIPYNLRQNADEAYYHSLFQMLMTLIGIEMLPERLTSIGRIDGVIEFEKTIYLIEFKYSSKGTVATLAKKAVTQIKRNKYYEAYQSLQKEIVFLGIGFLDKEDKNHKRNLVIDYKVGGLKEDD